MSERTKELIKELVAIRGAAKLYPSGAQGQTIGQETWRITLSGNSLQSITDAADKLNELEQQRDKLLAALEFVVAEWAKGDDVFGSIQHGRAVIAEVKGSK